jgi:adenine-specific DNA-methyltransferase
MMNKIKQLGQIFTPAHIAEKVLQQTTFPTHFQKGQKIFEPSFGEGIFIKHIIKHLHNYATKHNYTPTETTQLIDDTIWGVEYDKELYNTALTEIKTWTKNTFNLTPTFPHLYNMDALDFTHYNTFTYVVGNPPYVRIHNMSQEMRNKIKTYEHSTGTTDLYIIFYELGLKWLTFDGTLSYIAPNSWLKNHSQKKFRKNIIANKMLKTIIDYSSNKNIFDNISTYTCITTLTKQPNTHIKYMLANDNKTYVNSFPYTDYKNYNGEELIFPDKENYVFLKTLKTQKPKNYIYHITNGLTTGSDKNYIYTPAETSSLQLETTFLQPVVKASTFKGEPIVNKIFFPYHTVDNKIVGISEEMFKNSSPNLYNHLLKNKQTLLERDLDTKTLWFHYSRSQAIQETFKPKLLLNPIMSENQQTLKTFIIPSGTLIYSGLFITAEQKVLHQIKNLLETENFTRYIKTVGKDLNSGYKTFNTKHVKQFLT